MVLFISFRWLDFIDILFVSILLFQLYRIIRGTVAIRIFIGIFALYIFWKTTEALKMNLLSEILGQFIGVGVIALIIVFQQELRRFLLLIGTKGVHNLPLTKRLFKWKSTEDKLNIDAIIKACKSMSDTKTGALIIIPKESDIMAHITSWDTIDAKLSARLLECIFYKNNPLHDGGVTLSKNKILTARCVLPVTSNTNFPDHLGMRHRAAAGITEVTDAIALIVSEQTGHISYGKNGFVSINLTINNLREFLTKEFNQ